MRWDGMSKKVFVLSGIPRKNRNSDVLCDQFVKSTRHHEVTKAFLAEQDICYCITCDGCRWHYGEYVIKEKMAKLFE